MRNILASIIFAVVLLPLAACPDEEQLRPDREQLEPPAREQKEDINNKQMEEQPMQQQPPPAGEKEDLKRWALVLLQLLARSS